MEANPYEDEWWHETREAAQKALDAANAAWNLDHPEPMPNGAVRAVKFDDGDIDELDVDEPRLLGCDGRNGRMDGRKPRSGVVPRGLTASNRSDRMQVFIVIEQDYHDAQSILVHRSRATAEAAMRKWAKERCEKGDCLKDTEDGLELRDDCRPLLWWRIEERVLED